MELVANSELSIDRTSVATCSLGTVGFMAHDYANFGFHRADVVIAVGYDLVEYSPTKWNPDRDKKIIHIHRTTAEVDANYELSVGIQGSIAESLEALALNLLDQGDFESPAPLLR